MFKQTFSVVTLFSCMKYTLHCYQFGSCWQQTKESVHCPIFQSVYLNKHVAECESGCTVCMDDDTVNECMLQRAGFAPVLLSTGPPTHHTYKSSLGVEILAVELLAHSFRTDVDAREGLDLCSYWASELWQPFHAVHLRTQQLCNLLCSAALWLSCFHFAIIPPIADI